MTSQRTKTKDTDSGEVENPWQDHTGEAIFEPRPEEAGISWLNDEHGKYVEIQEAHNTAEAQRG